jgi:hypothetical protein
LESFACDGSAHINDDDLRALARFPHLSIVRIANRASYLHGPPKLQVTDEGLRALSQLRLRGLRIGSSQITNAGLMELKALPLEELELWGSRITDDGLAHLSGLPLRNLGISHVPMTDVGLKHIRSLRLEYLELWHTGVTSQGLLALGEMRSLRSIDGDIVPRSTRQEVDEVLAAGLPLSPGETRDEAEERIRRKMNRGPGKGGAIP